MAVSVDILTDTVVTVEIFEGQKGADGPPGATNFAGATVIADVDELGVPYIAVTASIWGIDGTTGDPYFDTDGVAIADERAVPVFNADGTVSIVIPGTIIL